ncbi:hypothetical protein CYQ88_02225 [Hydrogenovibrio sp. SC-1]|uniref:TorF family putative porin n=1 Tax=Hydrogenovibrio sp. SC-1 TaxID=2065820 RepID=UPI000C7A5D89|nr:TorF family putative porin [Hydrogenovibrio sp. SC-1]PLA75068.1 hypothetical protein CYQ88_02225 [Hydrogenovibrio sp. SC-1]
MKKTNSIKKLLASMAIVSSAALTFAPATTHAGEVSYNAAVSNMYLWRGQNISSPSPAVFGGIDYAADSGFYVGTWTSSEGAAGSTEFDLYGGFAGGMGDFGYDIGYAAYLYPDVNGKEFVNSDASFLSEYIVGLSFKDLSATFFLYTEEVSDMYTSIDYSVGKFGLHAGMYKFKASGSDYTDFNVSYAATDSLSFTLSKAQGDGVKGAENPMIQVTYALPI